MFDENINAEKEEAFNEFIKEYGQREEDWTILDWREWDELFCAIKTYWNTKEVRCWREKTLKQFVYNLPNVKNSSLFHAFIQSDAIYLQQILNLV
jgi:hypothetical protein